MGRRIWRWVTAGIGPLLVLVVGGTVVFAMIRTIEALGW